MRIAFTGTGYIARIHAQAAHNLGLTLAAVVNHRPESAAQFAADFQIPRQYTHIVDRLRAGDVDALVICTPNYLHAAQTIAALKAGVHVLVEKPMAMNAIEAESMLAASAESGARLMVAHCWRFDDEVRWLRDQAAGGQIGRIVRTKGYSVHTLWGPGGWFAEARHAGGGALADMGIHAIDTVRYLLGDPQPVSVYARIGTHYGTYDVDDTGLIIINWANGVSSYIESGWWQPYCDGKEAHTQLYGTDGFGQIFPTLLRLPESGTRTSRQVDSGFPAVREAHIGQAMYDAQMAHFVACIRDGTTPNPGGTEGLVNMRIVDAAYASSRDGVAIAI